MTLLFLFYPPNRLIIAQLLYCDTCYFKVLCDATLSLQVGLISVVRARYKRARSSRVNQCNTDVSVHSGGEADGFFLAAVDSLLQGVDHLFIGVDFVIE